MNRDNSITALNLLSDCHEDSIANPARAILSRALEARVPDPEAMAAVESEAGPVLLILAAEGLFLASVVEVAAEAASGGYGVKLERWNLGAEDTSAAVTEHYEGQVETLIVRRWEFTVGSGRSLRFETRMYPHGHSPAEDFAARLASRLGWEV